MPTSEVLTTVSETVNGVPRLNGPPEFDTVCSTRSGNATVMAPADARQLLASSLSATTLVSSAHASRKYVPGGVADGIVTVTVRVDAAPAASVGTDRVPVSSLSSGLFYLLERTFNEVDWGPPVDYGYTNPRTGMPLVAEKSVPRKPVCRCDLRHSGREWVAYSEKGAKELQ